VTNAILAVVPKGGEWVIQFGGESFGPFLTETAARWVAFKLAMLYGRNGLRIDLKIDSALSGATANKPHRRVTVASSRPSR
jgi:hypothetical protein